ncbi:H/ACA ribonucleoprotein complex non-core subunit NAF1 [Cocos nucifera]|uniref:H/ACA ribonucleoprotein complex non-core subunit NAF1 n=1 Tax=Cocos nucifera TaxID=13894 RepID=A0A8K0NAD5_COCNU|nr:H/ACA ribonucleoprotein complex non-core subunit NAF1 [Cocos nucifera]
MDSPLRPSPNSNPNPESGRSPSVAAAAGEIDPSSESLAVEPDRASLFEDDVYGSHPDGSDRKGDDLELSGEGFGAGAVNIEESGSKSLEFGPPIDRKMGKVSLTVPSYATDSKEAGEIGPLSESLVVEPDHCPSPGVEVYGPNLDISHRKGAELELAGEEFGAGAVNPYGSASRSPESGSSIDQKIEKVSLTDPSYPIDSKENGDGVPMAVDAVPLYPGVDGSAQTSKEDGNGEISLSTESKMVGEDDATDSDEDSSKTESEESESDDDSLSEDSSSSSSIEEDEDGDSHDCEEDEKDREEAFIGSEGEEEDVKGTIKSKNELEIWGTRVIVEGSVNHNPLDEGSILWITDTRSPLGLVDEIFGPVKCPHYVVRYNSEKDVPAGIGEGTAVSFVTEFACKILNEKDLYKKGYDASGKNDEEVTDEVEFSDDEKEAEYKRSLFQEKRGIDDKRQGNRRNAPRKKKTKSKGAEPRKGLRPFLPHGQASLGANNSAYERGSCSLGDGNACVSAPPMVPSVPQAMNSAGCRTTISDQFSQQQPNAMWSPGMPPQHQPNAFWPYGMPLPLQQQPNDIRAPGMLSQQQPNAVIAGFQMNGSPSQQLGNHLHQQQQQQHQNQVSSGNMNAMPSQQQFFPLFGATASMPWPFRPSNVYAGPVAPWLVAPVGVSRAPPGQGNISMQTTEQSYQQISPAIVQPGMSPRLQFNSGSSSVRGTKPNVQGNSRSCGRGRQRRKG